MMIRRGSAGLGKVKGIDRNCRVGSWKCSDQAGPLYGVLVWRDSDNPVIRVVWRNSDTCHVKDIDITVVGI